MNPLWSFFLYSFLGWSLECVYARLVCRSRAPRRCRLLLPLCPVYGLSALAILALPEAVQSRPALLFLCGSACATLTEYAASVFYERAWRVSFWDYSGFPGNLGGRVCLPFSLCWGVLALGLVDLVHPALSTLAAWDGSALLPWAVSLFVSDTVVTGLLLRRSRRAESLRWGPVPQPERIQNR